MAFPEEVTPETDVVLRWLECEEGMQDRISEVAAKAAAGADDRLAAAAEAIRRFVEEQNPLRDEVSLYGQLLQTALDRVQWDVLAEWLLPEDEGD